MKKFLRMFLFAAGMVSLAAACDESEWEVQNLFPDEYHKILYILDSGEKEVTLYKTGSSAEFTYSVVKAGSEPAETAAANVRILSQEEVDTKYSNILGTPYWVIPDGSYEVKTKELLFGSDDAFTSLSFAINPEAVETFMKQKKAADPAEADYMQFVLPVWLEGATAADSVNKLKNYVLMNIKNIQTPQIGFSEYGVKEKDYSLSELVDMNQSVEVVLDVDNQWNFVVNADINKQYVADYNAAHGTDYQLLDLSMVTFDKEITFTETSSSATLNLSVKLSQLASLGQDGFGDYMLPITLGEETVGDVEFGRNDERATYVFVVKNQGKFSVSERASWAWSVNSWATNEGTNGYLQNVYDGDHSSYWHSRWSDGEGVTNQLPYIFNIDFGTAKTIHKIGLVNRNHSSYTDTKAGFVEVSTDGITYEQVGTFNLVKGDWNEQVFDLTPVKARYFRFQITESYRAKNCALGEVYLYGI